MRRWLCAWAEVLLAATIVLAIARLPAIMDALVDRPSPNVRLICAAGCRDRAEFDNALAEGASPNARDRQGNTALAVAAMAGDTRMTERLIELGANVNSADICGFTPLMYAAMHDHVQLARMLLHHGADPGRATYASRLSALDLAKLNGSARVADVLVAYASQ
jgi:ankyrin repeat protein